MISYLGNFAEDATVYIMFNTFSSDDPSASCTITNFANTDVHIHKDDGLAQRNNAAGITVSTDFDGITGSHMVKIDTSDDTVAGFWVAGHEYFVRIEGTTIDGATVNSVIGQFSIENRFNGVDVVKWLGTAPNTPTVAGVPEVDITHLLGTAWLTPGVAGTPDVNAKLLGGTAQTGRDVGASVLLSTGTGAGQLDFTSGIVKSNLTQIGGVAQSLTDFKDLVDTGYDPVNHKIQSDLIYIHGTALTETDGQLAAAFKKLFDVATPLLVASDVMRGTDGANTTVPDVAGTAATPAEVATALTDINLDHLVKIAVDTNWATTVHLDSVLGHIADVGTSATFSRTTDALEAIRNKQTDIETDTAEIGTAGAGLTDLGGMSTGMKAEAESEVNDALVALHLDHLLAADYDPASKPGVATALLNELVENDGGVSRYTANALEQAPSGGTNPNVLIDTTINGAPSSQTVFVLTAGSDIDDAYKDQAIVLYDASNNDYPSVRKVSAYTGATKTVTLDSAPDFTIIAGDGVKTFVTAPGTTAPTVGQIRTEMEGVGYFLDLIKADTNELQTNQGNWVTATGFATSGAMTTAQNDLDKLTGADGATLATLQGNYAPNKVVPDAEGVAPTAAEIKTAIEAAGSHLARILADTGTDGVLLAASATSAQLVDDLADEVLTGATHNVADSLGRRIREVHEATVVEEETAQGGTASTITLAASANANDDFYNKSQLKIVGGTGVGQTRTFKDYNGATKVATACEDWIVTPDNTSKYIITGHACTAVFELNNGIYDLINAEVKDCLTIDTIADSYATDGNQPTIAQGILAIQQMLHEKSIAGTTLTVKKPDGSTVAMTFTLDSATAPTSITRAT
jgi:hypothetical protein